MRPIYEPKGKAGEYAELALNVYTGCTNGCEYCYAPAVLRKTREAFARGVAAREGLVAALERQLSQGGYEGRTVHLCFTCDPYPFAVDTSPTRAVIGLLKDAGCHVQILTKNPSASYGDWDLLDGGDWIGTTFSGDDSVEPCADRQENRIKFLAAAKAAGLRTWVSCEPVLVPEEVYRLIREGDCVDLFKFGKLNYRPSEIDWASFGREAARMCELHGRAFVLKESLLDEMGRGAL